MRAVFAHTLPAAMRQALGLAAVFAVSALMAGGIAWVVMSEDLRGRLFDDARLEAEALVAQLGPANAPLLERQILTVARFGDEHGTLYYILPAGRTQPIGNMSLKAPFEGPRRLLAGRDVTLLPNPGSQEGEVYFAYGVHSKRGWIIIARDGQWIADTQEVLVQSIVWGLGIALAATVLLALLVARRDAHRVARLNAVLDAVAAGDFSARYPGNGRSSDDLTKVALGLNAMLAKLQANVERLSQVSADIAHDLRSPLTRLRLRLEPHAVRTDIPAETQRAVSASLITLDEIAASFDAIMQLSQLETGNLALETTEADLCQIVRDVVEMLTPAALDTGHELHFGAHSDTLKARVNVGLITQALVNLIDNALRHTPAGTAVEIALGADPDWIELDVCDNGPGIPSGEIDKVMRRFYRVDKTRNHPGTGLGLSLVSAIARLHGGALALTNRTPPPGLCAHVRLKRLKEAASGPPAGSPA